MKALSLKYSNPVLSQIQGCAIFLRYWVKLLRLSCERPRPELQNEPPLADSLQSCIEVEI